jgi:DNA-binding MarR family transcriptional regulator
MTEPRLRHATAADSDASWHLAELLSSSARRLRRASLSQLEPLGLTLAQARVLRVVADADEPLRMADIAGQLDVVPRSVTSMVDALEAAGLVRRETDAEDRRSVRVALTGRGRGLLERLHAARHQGAEDLFAPLSGADRAALHRLLGAMCGDGACGEGCCPAGTGGRGQRGER